jgi:hypothetical protein
MGQRITGLFILGMLGLAMPVHADDDVATGPHFKRMMGTTVPGDAVSYDGNRGKRFVCRVIDGDITHPGYFDDGACHYYTLRGEASVAPLSGHVDILTAGPDTRWYDPYRVPLKSAVVSAGTRDGHNLGICYGTPYHQKWVGWWDGKETCNTGPPSWKGKRNTRTKHPQAYSHTKILVDVPGFKARELARFLPTLETTSDDIDAAIARAGASADLEKTKAAHATLQAALDEAITATQRGVKALDPAVHAEASQAFEKIVGPAMKRAKDHLAALDGRIKEAEKKQAVAAARAAATALQEEQAELVADAAPTELEAAQDLLGAMEAFSNGYRGIRSQAVRGIDRTYREDAEAAFDEIMAPWRERMEARKQAVADFIEVEKAKLAITERAAPIAALVAKAADTEDGQLQKALLALDNARAQAVNEAEKVHGDPGLANHAQETWGPLLAELDEAVKPLQRRLPVDERVARLEARLATLQTEDQAGSMQGVQLLLDLMSDGDAPEKQAEATDKLRDFRDKTLQTLYDLLEEQRMGCYQGWMDEDGRETAPGAFFILPSDPGTDAKTPEARALANDLKQAGFLWRWPVYEADEEDGHGDVGCDGPVLMPEPGWWSNHLEGKLSDEVLARLDCLDSYQGISTDWLLRCQRAIKAHKGSPVMDRLVEEVNGRIPSMKNSVDGKACRKIAKKTKRTAFKAAIGEACKEIKAKEAHIKKLAKAEKTVEKHIAAKRFKKARKALKKLEKIDPDAWQVSSLQRRIQSAEEDAQAQKDAAARRREAAKLKRKVPSFERLCEAELKKWRDLDRRMNKAYQRGRPGQGDRLQTKRNKAADKGCEAQYKVLKVIRLYEADGNSDAARAVRRAAPTCLHRFTCR